MSPATLRLATSTEDPGSWSMRLRIAVVRAVVDEVERAMRELDQPLLASVGRQLAEELGLLALALRRRAAVEDGTAEVLEPAQAHPAGERPRTEEGQDLLLEFAGFRLDLREERLWKGGQELRLRRKPFAILRYLAQHPRRLVTQAEIIDAVWGHIAMSDSLLRTHVRELRNVLGDPLIETVVGRGYRFVVDVEGYDDRARKTTDASGAFLVKVPRIWAEDERGEEALRSSAG